MSNRITLWARPFILPLSITFITLLIQTFSLTDLFEFERSTIKTGSVWRIVSGHLCHLDWQHLLLNNIALLIIWELFFRTNSLIRSLSELLFLSFTVSAGIYFFNPNIEWYVGLSGVLHGLFVIGIADDVFKKNWLSILVAIGFVGKIIWEQTVGVTTGFLFDADTVLVDAHLYGAIGGVLLVLYFKLLPMIKSKPVGGSN